MVSFFCLFFITVLVFIFKVIWVRNKTIGMLQLFVMACVVGTMDNNEYHCINEVRRLLKKQSVFIFRTHNIM